MTAEEKRSRLEKYTLLRTPPYNVVYKDGGHTNHVGVVEDEVSIIADDCDSKHALHKIRLTEEASKDGCKYAYRIGYWAFAKDESKVVWGQFHSTLSEREWAELVGKARKQGWQV